MNKPEFIAATAKNANAHKTEAEHIITNAVEVISDALARGESVSIPDFGKFEVKSRAERKGRNPVTGDPLTIPASKTVVFKPAKALKDNVNA